LAGAVALSIGLVPVASAATIPPYKGVVQAGYVSEHQGCASLLTPTKGVFNLTTGKFSYVAKSSAHTCAKSVGSIHVSFADQEALINGALPLKLPSGVHSVAVKWLASWAFSGSENHTGSNACPVVTTHYSWGFTASGYCDAAAQVDLRAESWIYDATNRTDELVSSGGYGAYAFNLSENVNDTSYYCYTGGSCTSSNFSSNSSVSGFSWVGSSSNTQYINATFVSGHHYFLIFQTLGATIADCEGWNLCSAKASLNLGNGSGHGIALSSITVT
jgi:hypothetical protein